MFGGRWLLALPQESDGLEFLLLFVLILAVFLALEYVEQGVCAPHEVRVIRVDVRVLYLYELNDHVCGGREALVQDLLHHVRDLVL